MPERSHHTDSILLAEFEYQTEIVKVTNINYLECIKDNIKILIRA